MTLRSLISPIVIFILCSDVSAGQPIQSTSKDYSVGAKGTVFAQLKFKVSRHRAEKPRLRYAPVKSLDGCPSISPDFGQHPNEGPLKGLGQHLQVAMEVSCTNFFMRCAYALKDFDLVAEAISNGLLIDASRWPSEVAHLQGDQESLRQGIASGASAVHRKGINSHVDRQEKDGLVKCNALPQRSEQLKALRKAIQMHFQAYQASPARLREYPSLAEGIALAFCDQIGDRGDSPCNDLMSKAIRDHYVPTKLSNVDPTDA